MEKACMKNIKESNRNFNYGKKMKFRNTTTSCYLLLLDSGKTPTKLIQRYCLPPPFPHKLTSTSFLITKQTPKCSYFIDHAIATHQGLQYLSSPNQSKQLPIRHPQMPLLKPNCQCNLSSLLRSSTNLHEARKAHGLLLVTGFLLSNRAVELGSQLVSVYAAFDSLQESLLVFNRLPNKTVFAWNMILKGFVNVGEFSEAIEFYHLMISEGVVPDNFTYPLVLKACSGLSSLEYGRKVQESIYFNEMHHKKKPNIFVECAMIDMFAKCGSLNEARRVFDGMPRRDLVSWTAMICGTVHSGEWFEALDLYRRMRIDGHNPDSVIVATVLPACSRLGALHLGMGLQAFAVRSGIESDLCVTNAFIDMYCKCENTHEAGRLFCHMKYKDVISWSSLIAGHSQNCEYNDSFQLYLEMKESGVRPSPVTFAGVLPAFANLKLFKQGKEIHSYVIRHGFEFDGFVSSALIDMYAKCGSMTEAESIFEITSDREIGIWNSMIAGYVMDDDIDSAFQILQRIRESKFRPNSITIMSVLPLCTRSGMLSQGKEVHGYMIRSGLASVVSVANPLIDMYCKCGNLEFGIKVVEQMIEKDVVTYNTIISALGMHGDWSRAFSFFSQMKQARIMPNKVTFIAVLAACSHAGLTDIGWSFYNSMINDYGIMPDMEHYSCIVDLLGRSGRLDDAWEFIKNMAVEPGIDVLGSLLGACRVHNVVELAELVGKWIFDKNPEDPGYYVLLSNIYATAGRWEDAKRIRAMMKEKGLIKKPGYSWVQVRCSVHTFLARDISHPEISRIHKVLKSLLFQIKDEGYIPDTSFLLHDLGGDDEDLTSVNEMEHQARNKGF